MSLNINILVPATGTTLGVSAVTSTVVASVKRTELLCTADAGTLQMLNSANEKSIADSRKSYGQLLAYNGFSNDFVEFITDPNTGAVLTFEEACEQVDAVRDAAPAGRGTSLVGQVAMPGGRVVEAYLMGFEDAEIGGKKVPVARFRIKIDEAKRKETAENISADRRAMAQAGRMQRRVI